MVGELIEPRISHDWQAGAQGDDAGKRRARGAGAGNGKRDEDGDQNKADQREQRAGPNQCSGGFNAGKGNKTVELPHGP
ncbi:hypothetical protein [Sinimarinibacterium sp. NLF-5-8]|uniref:hypothetical protein n=1 Tax=Sinimarinibacterium sp. NLF-5-8 TaxID=2698684 RepID=UPI00137C0D92|nr:hypothetical protein [Sinimarinibacterium sp. NLF-5-8]QHS11349.1 hypothetical protein GT972_15130 [Sinimarinibacterium sp. NLF-5-8]